MSTLNTNYGAESIKKLLHGCKNIFFIGIGGVSMSSLARITASRGYCVSGSDRSASSITEELERSGIRVYNSHAAENVANADAVVYTVAIRPDNPEYLSAKERGIPCISRADYLGYLMTEWKYRVGISGMHGKSTCTGMCASVYMAANADPTVLSGASYAAMGGYYRLGKGESFIFEACEYMDSFLAFNPTTAVVLNVELEHIDYFKNIENIRRSYSRFVELTGEDGIVVYNADDPDAAASVGSFKGRRITFGLNASSDFTAANMDLSHGTPRFDIVKNGSFFCHVELLVPGMHNVYNALAAAAAADSDGISSEAIAKGLSSFKGIHRRMEYKGRLNGSAVYDDYAHHPTEIAAALAGARALCDNGQRLVCAFQPHTYSRTAALFDDFANALSAADEVLLAPIYAARETDTLGVSSERLAEAIGERAYAVESLDELSDTLKKTVSDNCLTVVMGAGDIERIFKGLDLKP